MPRLTAPSCTTSQACTFFLFLKIGRRNPLQDLTPLPIRAGSLLLAQALFYLVSAVGSFFTYIWIHASG